MISPDALMEVLQNEEKFSAGNLPSLIRNTIILPHKHQHRKAAGKSSSTTIKQFDREGRPLFSEDGLDVYMFYPALISQCCT